MKTKLNTTTNKIIICILCSLFFSCVTDTNCGKCLSINDVKYINNTNTDININFYKTNIVSTSLILKNNRDTMLFEFDGIFANRFDSVHILYDSTKIKRVIYNSNTNCDENRNVFCENNYQKSSIYTYTFTTQDYIEADTIQ